MPNVNEMFPSRWLKASDCSDADLTLTISGLQQEEIGQGQKQELKWVLYFEEYQGDEIPKGLVLNKTNTNSIVKLYGEDSDDWIGKQITMFACEVQFGNDMVEAIRVRSKMPKRPPARPAPAAQPQAGQRPGNGTAAPRGQAPARQAPARQTTARSLEPPDPGPNDDADPDSDIPF